MVPISKIFVVFVDGSVNGKRGFKGRSGDSRTMKPLPVLPIALVTALLLSGLAVTFSSEPAQASELTRFTTDAEMRYFINTHAEKQDAGRQEAVSELDTAASGSYSRTNVQVDGVDESDLVKTDGRTLFIAEQNKVHLIDTLPSLSNITYVEIGSSANVTIQGLYLHEDHLAVIYCVYELSSGPTGSSSPGEDIFQSYYIYPYYSSRTCIQIYDVSDPSNPTKVLLGGITGHPLSSRMVGSVVYLLTEHSVLSGEDISVPQVLSDHGTEDVSSTSIYYDPACPSVSSFVNVLALDVVDGSRTNLTALAGSSSVCYMSVTSLYITMSRWEGASSGLLTTTQGSLTTTIYRISVDGTRMTLAAQGSVEGGPLNQFALDEREGRLRVATTSYGDETDNQVHILDMALREVGSLEGIAPGESIYSTRYLDDRLYMVTFRQVDPLFIIDLSEDDPVVMGELKVPGASTYLQMVEDGLLGIGFENGSVKISLYNVSDPENMEEIDTYLVEGCSYSAAQYDHRAVLYDAVRKVLVIPVTFSSYSGGAEYWTYQRPWSVGLVLEVGESGIDQIGAITHKDATVSRSLYIGDILYTISDTTVKANSLSSLISLGSLIYSEGQSYYGWYATRME